MSAEGNAGMDMYTCVYARPNISISLATTHSSSPDTAGGDSSCRMAKRDSRVMPGISNHGKLRRAEHFHEMTVFGLEHGAFSAKSVS